MAILSSFTLAMEFKIISGNDDSVHLRYLSLDVPDIIFLFPPSLKKIELAL